MCVCVGGGDDGTMGVGRGVGHGGGAIVGREGRWREEGRDLHSPCRVVMPVLESGDRHLACCRTLRARLGRTSEDPALLASQRSLGCEEESGEIQRQKQSLG